MTPRRAVARAFDLAIIAPAAMTGLLPYRWRWTLLCFLSRPVSLIAAVTRRYADGYGAIGLVTRRENVIHALMVRATQLRIGFAPAMTQDGIAALDAALASGRPVMLVGVHAELLYLAARFLIEQGYDILGIRAFGKLPIIGDPDATYPSLLIDSPRALLRLSRALRPGRAIAALIDSAPGRRAYVVEIGGERINIAFPLLKLALDRDATLVFFHPRLIGHRVRIRWRACAASDLGGAIAAFGHFLAADADRVSASPTILPPGS